MDFGFGDAVAGGPEEIEYPTILSGLPAPRLRAYPREASLAEKFEAMVSLDTRNSRMKDFHDVWALSGAFAFDGAKLQRAIAACFERRGTPLQPETPRVLTSAFYQAPEIEARWRAFADAIGRVDRERMTRGAAKFVDDHQWYRTLAPLRAFVRKPRMERTKETFATQPSIPERPPASILDRLKRRVLK